MTKRPPNLTAPVLAVIPCLNEEDHIESVVTRLLAEADRINLGIVVADGGSSDNSREIVNRLAQRDRRIVLMGNPMRIQAAGINAAVRRYGDEAQFLLRVDAHAHYPDRYCEHLLKVQARTQADAVVVSMNTEGHTCFERAAAAAQNSILGNGGAAHRNEIGGRWVDHGHHALMTIDAFDISSALAGLAPTGDVHASAVTRTDLARVHVRRALEISLSRAQDERSRRVA